MLARILAFSVHHRFLVVLLAVAIGVLGAFSLAELPIDAVPDITNNQIQINTLDPALSPLEVEKQITFPIETALSGIPGLQYTRSLSRNGFSQVTAVFEDDVNIYFARTQVNERLSLAKESLPPEAEPTMGAISTGLGEIYMYAVEFEKKHRAVAPGEAGWQPDGSYLTAEGERLKSSIEKAAYLRTVQDWIIRPQLRGIAGVADVDSVGGYVKEYHVYPDPQKLIAFNLTFAEVIEALEKNNVSTGAGYIEHKGESYLVRAGGRITTRDQIADIVVGTRNGTPIRVFDVATVGVGGELRTGSASENGEEVVIGTALMLIGANSRTVAAAVDQRMKEINRGLPEGVSTKTVLNRTKLVNATIQTVRKNLLEGALLVIAILFFMLGNFRAALITALAIPLSMLITAIGMLQTKISGNLMSLGAIDFGLIVDGAVIIVENCLRRLADKQHQVERQLTLNERLHEVMRASKEMIQPSVYGQAIIVIVYVPILTLTGVEGKMFHPMAMTVIFALLGAFVLSLTFIPAMVALFINGRVEEKDNRIVTSAKNLYLPFLRFALERRLLVVSIATMAFFGSIALFTRLGQEFVPTLDEKDLLLETRRIPSASLTQSTLMQFEIEKAFAKFPEVAFVFSKTGTAEMASDPMPPSQADTFVILKPQEDWPNPSKSKGELVEEIEKAGQALPGDNFEFSQPIQMRFNELLSGVKSDVAVKIFGDEFEQIEPVARKVAALLQSVRGAGEVKVEQTEGLPVMNIDVDREAISRLGLRVADVQDVVSIAVGGKGAGLLFQGDRRFSIKVRLSEEVRSSLAAIDALPVPMRNEDSRKAEGIQIGDLQKHAAKKVGKFVPLGTVAKLTVAEGLNQISRENGKRRIVVQTNVRGRDLGSFVEEARSKLETLKPPPGGWFEWGGQFENLTAARKKLTLVVPICFFLIFLLLFSSFNSARHALLVFSGVPLGLTGGVVALWLRGLPFSISAAVGFIALSGVAVLNGLVMVSFVNQLRQEGKEVNEALLQGCLTRLRPVLMTALVASFGFVPMALATGTGAEVQQPLATVVIGGLISSTLLTLVVLPALYRMFGAVQQDEVRA